MPMFPRWELPFGYVELTGENGIKIVSTKKDPSELRGTVMANQVESNLFKVTFGLERTDGSGVDDELAYIMGRLRADKKGGALYFAVANRIGEQAKEVFYIDNGICVFQVPIKAPGLTGWETPPPASGDPFAEGVTALYLELLGRAPEANVIEGIWRPQAPKYGTTLTEQLAWVRAAIMESPPYKERHS